MRYLHAAFLCYAAFCLVVSGCTPVSAESGPEIVVTAVNLKADPVAAVEAAKPACGNPECCCENCSGTDCPCGTSEPVSEPVPVKAAEKPPHLIVTVADKGCPPCDRFEREELPRLVRSGWRVKIRRVPFGAEATPSFELRSGAKWAGYSNVADFEARIAPPAKAVPSVALGHPDRHSHLCGRCGTEFWHSASETANNPRAHNCPKCGSFQNVVHRFAGVPR